MLTAPITCDLTPGSWLRRTRNQQWKSEEQAAIHAPSTPAPDLSFQGHATNFRFPPKTDMLSGPTERLFAHFGNSI